MLRETTDAAVTARFFGDFSVHVCGRPVERWRAGKARSLFQYLLVNRGRVVTRDKLYQVLWPDQEWSPTGSSLKVAMHGVRQVLHAVDSDEPAVEIVNRDHGYLLKADDVWLDLDEFSSAIDTARAAELAGGASTPALDQVLNPLPLTGRELEIAIMVSEGMTNKAIAERLSVSVRTVEGHIYRSCIKLDVADRTLLAEVVASAKTSTGLRKTPPRSPSTL